MKEKQPMRRFSISTACILAGLILVDSCKDLGDNVEGKQLAISRTSFSLVVGDSGSATISGGTQPYSFVSKGDTMKAVPSILGSSLKVRALAAGSSVIVIGDNGSPMLTDTISVNVSVVPLISFSSEIQPMFTANCVNAGCHPGGGAPFPLQSGVSYTNLVGVNATTGPCLPIKRVQASNANASALVKRLEGTCGDQMPLGRTPLSTTQIQLIRDWINQGALNN